MSPYANIWAQRFEPLLQREALKQAAEYYPEPLVDLGQYPLALAAEILKKSLESIFYPSEQCLDILEGWVGEAYAHASLIYTDPLEFCAAIQSQLGASRLPEWHYPSILTGLGGLGKTAVSEAYQRAVTRDGSITTPDGTVWPLKSSWYVKFRDIKTENGFWQRLGSAYTATHDNVSYCRNMAYRSGICHLGLDELQFYTLSKEANTNIARLMMAAGSLGLPITAVGNYSLVRRLMKRDPPERQRLLSNVKVMMPDDPDGPDWEEFLLHQQKALPEILAIDPKKDGPRINLLSGGQKRSETRLITIAYKNKRDASSNGDVKITLADLEVAYKSREFQFDKNDIEEALHRILMNERKEDDLSCPIELPETQVLKFKRRAEQERASRVARRALEDALTAEDKQHLKDAFETTPKQRASATVRSINSKKSPKQTLADLARNSAMFSENI
jgi:hypothetical protein